MLSQTTEYALRAAVWLAQNHGTSQTTRQIAAGTKVPVGYLSKVLQVLGRAGLVRALRGKRGGFELAKPPAGMKVLEIVDVVDPIQRIRACPLGLESHSRNLCPLHTRIDQALASIEASFDSTSLADLLAPPDDADQLARMVTGN
jgi:Rrf2 family protein